jgi:hypothetical protein
MLQIGLVNANQIGMTKLGGKFGNWQKNPEFATASCIAVTAIFVSYAPFLPCNLFIVKHIKLRRTRFFDFFSAKTTIFLRKL